MDAVWERLQTWSTHNDVGLRLAAAHILSSWRTAHPEKANPLLQPLVTDNDAQVAAAAQVEARLVITLEDLAETHPVPPPPAAEPTSTEAIDPELLEAIKIIGPEEPSEPDFQIRLLEE